MVQLAFDRHGTGEPLVLLHGLGSSRHIWDPVVPALAEQFDVVAVDLPGFGDSAPLPPDVEPRPATLAAAVADLLDELAITAPHLVGNSLGGWVGLELARARPTSSLTLLSPAGLWRERTPIYTRASLRVSRWLTQHLGGALSLLVTSAVGRTIVLGQTHGRPDRLTVDQAHRSVRDMAACPGFDATLRATVGQHYQAEPGPFDVPVTVAFGSRDLVLLPWQSRHVEQLPSGTRVVRLQGCGHVPLSDDPDAVTRVVTATAARAGRRDAARRRPWASIDAEQVPFHDDLPR